MGTNNKLPDNWRGLSLTQLEGIGYGDPSIASTPLVKRCLVLESIPIGRFTIEDLRLMIGQQFGLIYLVPLAIEKLNEDLFAEGDLYPGDLLEAVLRIPPDFWLNNKLLSDQVRTVISGREEEIASMGIKS